MEVFLTYLTILFLTSTIGETLITFTQDVFLYGIKPVNWAMGLPKSLGAVWALSLLIALFVYLKMRPIITIANKVKKNESVSDDEKLVFARTLPGINKVTMIGLGLMYAIGNFTSTFIRTRNGVFVFADYTSVELRCIIVAIILQALFYAISAIIYCSEVFTLVVQKQVKKLGLVVIPENIKEHPFTIFLGIGAVMSQLFGTINIIILIVGVSIMGQSIPAKSTFYYAIFLLLADALCFYPMAKYMFASLRKRLDISNRNIRELVAEGDLTKRQSVETTDGFGILNSNINSLIIHLQSILTNIKNAVSVVDENANNLRMMWMFQLMI